MRTADYTYRNIRTTTLSTEKDGMSYRVSRGRMSGTRMTVERMNRKRERERERKKNEGAKREKKKGDRERRDDGRVRSGVFLNNIREKI